MAVVREKATIKKLLFIPLFIGILSSYISLTHGSYTIHTKARNSDPSQSSLSPVQKRLMTMYNTYLILEICATIIEGFNIKNMGSTSAESIRKAGLASATMHGIKTAAHLVASLTTKPTMWPSIIIDLYFLSQDVKKVENSKELAAFYTQHRKASRRVKAQQGSQIALLLLSALVRITLYASLAGTLKEKFNFRRTGLLVCGVIDFFRKQARYNAELSERFENWLSEQNAEEDEEDKENEE